jgi:acyl dehydratase
MTGTVLHLKSPLGFADVVGTEFGPGRWVTLDQDLIDRFAETTGDTIWYHTDPERARRELPGGRTIAHGLLTLSLIPGLLYELITYDEVGRALSYGYDRMRFPVPVQAGQRVRLRGHVASAERREGALFATIRCTMELEGSDKPALVTDMHELVFDD